MGLEQGQHGLGIDAGGGQQGVEQGGVWLDPGVLEQTADQRVAVGVSAAAGQADEHVAGGKRSAVDDPAAFHHADAEPCQVVVATLIESGHLGGLAAYQRAAGQFAAAGDALDDPLGHIHVERTGGVVVEEQERLGAGDQHVIDAHGHQILADAIVPVVVDGELQLGADAVGAGDQDGLAVFLGEPGQSGEAAEPGQLLRAARRLGGGSNASDQFVAGLDIHPGVAVSQALRGQFRLPILGLVGSASLPDLH